MLLGEAFQIGYIGRPTQGRETQEQRAINRYAERVSRAVRQTSTRSSTMPSHVTAWCWPPTCGSDDGLLWAFETCSCIGAHSSPRFRTLAVVINDCCYRTYGYSRD